MADHIHTIPVLDALRDPKGCAFCQMQKTLDKNVINFILGPAYMEDDVRMETDRVGFCTTHIKAMYKEQNRLGLALMLHTHMKKLCKDTGNIISGRLPVKLFNKDPAGMLPRLLSHLITSKESCYVCKRVNDTFERYISTFFYLWSRGGDDARLIKGQTSYCMPHFIQLLGEVDKQTRGKREDYLDTLLPLWQKVTQELEQDLDWFIQKFDHRNANEPWKNSKDALPRTMEFLGGIDD